MSRSIDIAGLMTKADPFPDGVPRPASSRTDTGADARAVTRDRVATAPDTSPPAARSLRRAWMVGVAAAVVLLSATFVAVDRQGSAAFAATPDPLTLATPTTAGAVASLQELANRVEGLPDDAGSGPGARIELSEWSLFTRVNGDEPQHSAVVPYNTTLTIDAAGNRTSRVTYPESGEPAVSATAGSPVRPLPSDPSSFRDRMAENNAPSSGDSGRFVAVVEAARETPMNPPARAAVLRYLADTPGLRTVGPILDRLDRSGVGYTVETSDSGLPTEYLIIVDPSDGRILGYEELLTQTAGKLNVHIPAVIEYTVWVSSTFTSGA